MKDVASYCRWKFLLEAGLRIPVGLVLLFCAFWGVPLMIADEVAKKTGSWSELAFGLIPLFVGFAVFSSGTRRLHAAFARDCWLRCGPEGIAFCLPYRANARALFLTCKITAMTLPWGDVLKIYAIQYRMNGLPYGQELVLETRKGRFKFGGYFKERPAAIVAAIKHDQTDIR